ncbi:MAG: hypothetical protein Q8R91_05620, partial [Candidatus Omnitrophota bacterium]|nr:hypothetical protein [Candidatus Omnitrophota bacterium]
MLQQELIKEIRLASDDLPQAGLLQGASSLQELSSLSDRERLESHQRFVERGNGQAVRWVRRGTTMKPPTQGRVGDAQPLRQVHLAHRSRSQNVSEF